MMLFRRLKTYDGSTIHRRNSRRTSERTRTNKGEVLRELLDRFTNADAYRRQYDQIATRCYKLYRAYQREAKRADQTYTFLECTSRLTRYVPGSSKPLLPKDRMWSLFQRPRVILEELQMNEQKAKLLLFSLTISWRRTTSN